MRKEAQGILKTFPAPPRSFRNSFQFTEVLGEEGDNLIGLSVVQGTNHNGIGRKKRHKHTMLNPRSLPAASDYRAKHSAGINLKQTLNLNFQIPKPKRV
jgi:hypothetical protein